MRYDVRAVKGPGGIIRLAIEAADGPAAESAARRQGYTVLSLRAAGRVRQLRWRREARFPLLLFAQELHALLEAGLPLVEALESLADKDRGGIAALTLGALVERLREGQSFSQALAASPAAFPAFFVATMRASERTGHLPEALARFAAYQGQLEVLKKRVIAACIYPALLIGVGVLVLAFLMVYVVPRFARIFAESGVVLPWSTQLLVAWGALVETHGALLAAGAIAGLASITYLLGREAVRARLLALLWRAGPLGERVRVFQLARFYRTLGMLLQGGLPMVPALELGAHVLPGALRERLVDARRRIAEGVATSAAMDGAGLATPVALRLLRVGERGGDMGEMLGRIGAFLDEETARWLDWFTRLFEPVLMAFIGILIGTIVALLYMPIFELAGAVQ